MQTFLLDILWSISYIHYIWFAVLNTLSLDDTDKDVNM